MEYDGRMYAQMGFTLAAAMLDAGPDDVRITPDAVTFVGKGKGGGDLVVPVRTHLPEGGGTPVPLTFDIPWVGSADWQHMYPQQPHLSIDKVYGVLKARLRIAENNRELDKGLKFLLNKADVNLGTHKVAEFEARARPPRTPSRGWR